MGGEEFLLVLPGTALAGGRRAAGRLRTSVAAHPWRPVTGDLPVTVSMGVTSTDSANVTDQPAMLSVADLTNWTRRSGAAAAPVPLGIDQTPAVAATATPDRQPPSDGRCAAGFREPIVLATTSFQNGHRLGSTRSWMPASSCSANSSSTDYGGPNGATGAVATFA